MEDNKKPPSSNHQISFCSTELNAYIAQMQVQRIPLAKIIAYSFGVFGWSISINIISVMLLYLYLPPSNAGMANLVPQIVFFGLFNVIALVTSSGRLFDAVVDPMIAGWSDRSKNPKGRRIPLMAIAVIPMTFFAIIMFYPPLHWAGAIAQLFLKRSGVQIQAYVSGVGSVKLEKGYEQMDLAKTDSNIVRCPDTEVSEKMIALIQETRAKGDTVGGIVTCVIKGCPVGLGEPVFDKLHADLGKAMLSINAVHGFEYGSGFAGTQKNGSENNDLFYSTNENRIETKTNFSGGIQGGISNGMDIYFNVAFKPVATLMQTQQTVDRDGNETEVKGKGRHDPCVVPRAVPIVEAMAALVIADHLLRQRTTQL